MAHIRKPPVGDRSDDWGPWTVVHFQSEESRDRFLRTVAATDGSGCGAEPGVDDGRRARVRWRPGQFLALNDIAYAHGGRIVVSVGHHRLA